jgi:hypothetical protein
VALTVFIGAGMGYHSNDARGTTITRDPSTGDSVDPVTPLVRAEGAEIGVRTVAAPHLQTSVTLWTLSLTSDSFSRQRRHDRSEPAGTSLDPDAPPADRSVCGVFESDWQLQPVTHHIIEGDMRDPAQRRRRCERRMTRETDGEEADWPGVQMPGVVRHGADPRTERITDHRQVRNQKECEEPYPTAVRGPDCPERKH